jgi:hypothetical protein
MVLCVQFQVCLAWGSVVCVGIHAHSKVRALICCFDGAVVTSCHDGFGIPGSQPCAAAADAFKAKAAQTDGLLSRAVPDALPVASLCVLLLHILLQGTIAATHDSFATEHG